MKSEEIGAMRDRGKRGSEKEDRQKQRAYINKRSHSLFSVM